MKRNISTTTTKRRRNRHFRQFPVEQLEVRTLLTSWVIGSEGDGDVTLFYRNTVDADGNTYVAGQFTTSVDWDPSGAAMVVTSNGQTDGFAARYNTDGVLAWVRKLGGATDDRATAVVSDGANAVLVAGFFTGSVDFTGDGISDVTSAGEEDCFVVKLDRADGHTLWYRTFGGTKSERVNDMGMTAGQVYLTGYFSETVDFNPGAGVFSLSAAGRAKNQRVDAFIQRLDANGDFMNAWQIGGTETDLANSIQVDSNGVTVLGQFAGTADFKPGSGTLNRTSAGSYDVFLARYTATGSPVWVQTIGGIYADGNAWGLSSSTDALYVTGSFSGTLDVDPGTAIYQVNSGDTSKALIVKYAKSDGSFAWARTPGQEAGPPAVVDPVSGNIYLGARFSGTFDFNPQSAGGELTSVGNQDAVLIKLDPQGNFLNAWRMGGANNDCVPRLAGVVGNRVHVVGWIPPGTADFPTGGTLTNLVGTDMFLMALEDPMPVPSALLAAGLPMTPVEQSLRPTDVQRVLAEAMIRWAATGVAGAVLESVNIQVANLSGATLGLASGNTITLDDNAAGWGWFVDATPNNDSEFAKWGNQGEKNRMDLLSVVMHELGHLLQQDHEADGVMAATLVAGVRNTGLVHEDSQVVDAVFSQFNEPHADNFLSAFPDERRWLHRPRLQRRK